jgi:iron complex outermembrane receptor protein
VTGPPCRGSKGGAGSFTKTFQFAAGKQIVGRSFADNANAEVLPAYTVVNGGVRWNPDNRTTLSLKVYNLFNTVDATSAPYPGQFMLGMRARRKSP